MNKQLNINEISQEFELTKDTLRYWEKIGLLPKIHRNQQGYRIYSDNDKNWIFYIKALRQAGMFIRKLKKFVSEFHKQSPSKLRKQMLIRQRQQLQMQAKELQKTINYLNYKIDHFDDKLLTYENEKLAYEQVD